MARLWQKNYSLDSLMQSFTVRNDYILDRDLVLSDVVSSYAHAKGLEKIGILTESETALLRKGLEEIAFLHKEGHFEIKAEDEDCIILRVHECHVGHANAAITSDYCIDSYAECNLLEETTGELCKAQGNCIPLTLRQFEIKTFNVFLSHI